MKKIWKNCLALGARTTEAHDTTWWKLTKVWNQGEITPNSKHTAKQSDAAENIVDAVDLNDGNGVSVAEW